MNKINHSFQRRSVGFDILCQILLHKLSLKKKKHSYKLDTVDQFELQCIKYSPQPNICPFLLEKNEKKIRKMKKIDFIIIMNITNESWGRILWHGVCMKTLTAIHEGSEEPAVWSPSGLLSGESLASPLWVNSVTLKELWQSFPLQWDLSHPGVHVVL